MQLFRLWVICLTEAYHKPVEKPLGKQMVHIEQGQFPTGRFDLHEMYNRGLKKKDRVSEYTVWRWLLTLDKGGFVSINSSTKYSIVTIVNWDLYQSGEHQNEQQMSNKRATNEQQMSTNKNVKNVKNEKKEEYTPEFESFWSEYPRKKEKKRAYSLFIKRAKEEPTDTLIISAKNYAADCSKNNTEERYIKHPATFLSDKLDYKDWINKLDTKKRPNDDIEYARNKWISEGRDINDFRYE